MGFERVEVVREYLVTMRDTSMPVQPEKPVMLAPVIRAIMMAPFESFMHLGVVGNEPEGSKNKGRHIYINRGSKVLGVAHLDSVREASHFWCSNDTIACPTIDNRIGAWILLHGLPSMGIYPDVLLTENEERGLSTAGDFAPDEKRWNWMFSFDRTGKDAVYYQYDDGDLEKAIKKAGIPSGNGSNSCICDLEHLAIQGVNVGCGMMDYHSDRAHLHLPILTSQMQAFAAMYREHENTRFSWEKPKRWQRQRGKRNNANGYTGSYPLYHDEDMYYGYAGDGSVAHNAMVFELIRRFRADADAVHRIMQMGISDFLDKRVSLSDWRTYSVIPDGAAGYRNKSACKCCGHSFATSDTKYSVFYAEKYCKACFIERMDDIQLMPIGWEYELSTLAIDGGI